MTSFGSQSMVGALKTVVVRRPDEAFGNAEPARWHYTAQPNLEAAQAEHDGFVEILRKAGAEVIYHESEMPEHADAIFTHDPVLVTSKGTIVLSMGKELRRGEEGALGQFLEEYGVPVHFRLHGSARAEGGDLMWLDEKTLAAGRGFRTNDEGVRQLGEALEPLGATVLPFHLPYGEGPASCLHLMSFISMVDDNLAVVFPPLMPVPLWEELERRGIATVEVPDQEFATMGPNVLAMAPRNCLMIEGNPVTERRLREAGCEVSTYRGRDLSLKAEGGATCLTRPIWRE